jgi:hypothetical protein
MVSSPFSRNPSGWRFGLAVASVFLLSHNPSAAAAACEPSGTVDLTVKACARAVQEALIWTGDYLGLVDGDAGAGTLKAIASFKTKASLAGEEGLDSAGFAKLIKAGQRRKAKAGFTIAKFEEAGVEIGLPAKLVGEGRREDWGIGWASPDKALQIGVLVFGGGRTLDEIMARMKAQPGRAILYERRRGDWFVLSGDDASGDKFYVRVEGTVPALRGFSITYPAAREKDYRPIVVAMASSFRLLRAAAPAGEASQRREPEAASAAESAQPQQREARRPDISPAQPRAQMPNVPWGNAESSSAQDGQ